MVGIRFVAAAMDWVATESPLLRILRVLAAFLARTDGRDKLAKFLQNYCRYRKYYASGSASQYFKRIQDSLSEFRSLIKFGKPVKNVLEIHEIVTQDMKKTSPAPIAARTTGFAGLPSIRSLKLVSLLADIGYKLGDNVEYLSHYKVLKFDEARCESWSKTFQFFAYLADVLVGMKQLFDFEKKRKQFDDNKTFKDNLRAKQISYLGDVADFLRVTPGFLAMYGLFGVRKHDGFSGVMGLIVGATGIWKVWHKCDA